MDIYVSASVKEQLEEAARLDREGKHDEAIPIYQQVCYGPDAAGLDAISRDFVLGQLIGSLRSGGWPEEALDVYAEALPQLAPCDAQFDAIYAYGLRRSNSSPYPFRRRERFYQLTRFLQRTQGVAGDVVECGTGRGLSSLLLCAYLRIESATFNGDGFHVFDSFEGLSEPLPEDAIPADHPDAVQLHLMMRPGHFSASRKYVQKVLAKYPEISFWQGWLPDSLQDQPERRYRFVHVDVDLYAPTLGVLQYFHPRLAPGGLIVSDDFNWPGAAKAIAEFASALGVKPQINEYGQACIGASC